jgi:ferredoxin-type protein NapH
MNDTNIIAEIPVSESQFRRFAKACLLALPMLLLTALMTYGRLRETTDPELRFAMYMAYIFLNIIFFLMIYTGKTYTYRMVFFVVLSVTFVLSFITNLLVIRGSMALTQSNMLDGETPFCHMVIPMIIVPAALTRTIIFPGSMLTGFASIASMLIIWIGASLALGRGWCSWACFFGGLDEGFSRVLRKPIIKKIPDKWTYMPYAVLLIIVISSAATLSPTYCEWLCPYKTVTEFAKVDSLLVGVQTAIFLSLFFGLVVTLPVLTKRRTQCGLFCPMGAFQSFTNHINVFDVRIDRDKCIDCGRCINLCPTFSLDLSSVEKGRTRITCSKCGQCVDQCRKGAAVFHIRGTKVGVRPGLARLLLLYPAFLFGATFGLGMISGALCRIIRLITTGSMI